ncbi:MAG: RNA polymerase sigma factor [Lachnospiraceae bacterium]|nr:RNA polymerase sigma factor [Lachnospiraceae bacterium]MBR1854975.1 RNA polymerase sigma factor [Lachnospiraceae bacterium]
MTRENRLFRKFRQGDLSAMDELVRMYYPEIQKYCVWHTQSKEQAEDATQETFLKALRFMDAYQHNGTFRAFLYKIALNTCIDFSRKKREIPQVEDGSEPIYEEKGFLHVEAEIDFQRQLEFLTDKQRELILLRYAQNLTLREVAEVTGSNLRTVQSNLRRALKQIKQTGKEKGWYE